MIFIQQKCKYEADNKRLLMVYKSAMAAYKLTDEYRAHQAALAEWSQQHKAKQSKRGKKRKADEPIPEL